MSAQFDAAEPEIDKADELAVILMTAQAVSYWQQRN